MVFILKRLIGLLFVFIGVMWFKYLYYKINKNRIITRGYYLSIILIVVGVLIIFGVLKLTD